MAHLEKSKAVKRSEKAKKAKAEAEAEVKRIIRNPFSTTGQTIVAGVERFGARKAARIAKGVAEVSKGIRKRAHERLRNPSATRKRKLLSDNPTK